MANVKELEKLEISPDELRQLKAFTERVRRRKEEYLQARPRLTTERSRLFVEGWKEAEGDDIEVRFAKAHRKILEGVPIVIRDGELIVGSSGPGIRDTYAAPEWRSDMYFDQLAAGKELTSSGVGVKCGISEEERQSILEDAEYFKNTSTVSVIQKAFRQIWGSLIDDLCSDNFMTPFWIGVPTGRGGDHFKLLSKGLNGVKAEIKTEMNQLKTFDARETHKLYLLQAGLIGCDAVIDFGKRYAQLAKDLAAEESNRRRKEELEDISKICERVPSEPAQSFREALQSFWTSLLAEHMFSGGAVAPCVGRLDQYLYPFYEKDVRGGKLTRDEAVELIALLIVKFCELEAFRTTKDQEAIQATHLINVSIGGQKPEDGSDASNELSFLILEAARQTKLPTPHISLRYHDGINEDLIIKSVETCRDIGAGIPAFFNEKVVLPRLLRKGIPIEIARSWAPTGCVESFLPARGQGIRQTFFNLPKVLELVLHNGVNPATGKSWGLHTGDPTTFASYEHLWEQFKAQLSFLVDILVKQQNLARVIRGRTYRDPYDSVLCYDCIKTGLDRLEGGYQYLDVENGFVPFGHQTVANSLSAIKKVVFDDKKIPMGELIDTLNCNFEGKEDVRHLLLLAPKWGNDDDYVDDIMKDIFNVTEDLITSSIGPWRGVHYAISRQGLSLHYKYGLVVGATPDGRKAREPLADGSVSPMRGTDVNGPLAVFKSASKVDQIKCDSTLLNMKISPTVVSTMEGIKKLISVIKTYFDLNGYHVQFNMISKETLLDAKKHPELHRTLLVRVAGYSAFFVDLTSEVQDEIIERTEYTAV